MPMGLCMSTDDVFDTDECFEWTLARDKDQYGSVRRGGKTYRAHRLAWEDVYGPIPPGMVLLHTCDNPPCIRLSHLRLGTVADNNADARAKGRAMPPPTKRRKQGGRGREGAEQGGSG